MAKKAPKEPHLEIEVHKARDLGSVILHRIIPRDKRYELGAYRFMYEALTFTQEMLGIDPGEAKAERRHVSGQQLLEGIRKLALKLFGPLAPTVFRSWGVQRTADFGEIVFNLVEAGLMGKTESDARSDFANGYDFDEAFGDSAEPA